MSKTVRSSCQERTLFVRVCQTLNLMRVTGTICSELEYFSGALYPDDRIAGSLHLLSEALKKRPNTGQRNRGDKGRL